MDIYFTAKASKVGSYINLSLGAWVFGYYVFCRGRHYILQEHNGNGYDERWETSEWIEIDFKTLKPYDKALQHLDKGEG